ncbi:TetR/AcrR family transcriptional regulator [Nocardioides panacisoli]|uniref:TetR/AcrR family transcriptional regulator n=1 Tax=Nocardioides panacisoli TaxID=627624 RepID=UPI001C62AB26|nr:TetR/AcrR family transcriptional regulator [Nocardioides panacisoli]QYJ03431.1 TetR/AcrR family transcriptional regulator [Nocardioides panacisoli]
MTPPPRKRGGSTPDPTVRDRVLTAFVEQVGEHGLINVSIDDVAKAAGVSRVTLYRRWPDRHALIIDGFNLLSTIAPEIPDDWTARQAFDAVFARVEEPARRRQLRQLLAELVAAAGYDEDARRSLHARQQRWREHVRAIVERGIATGELPADRDVDRAVEVLVGVATHLHLVEAMEANRFVDLAWSLLSEERAY